MERQTSMNYIDFLRGDRSKFEAASNIRLFMSRFFGEELFEHDLLADSGTQPQIPPVGINAPAFRKVNKFWSLMGPVQGFSSKNGDFGDEFAGSDKRQRPLSPPNPCM